MRFSFMISFCHLCCGFTFYLHSYTCSEPRVQSHLKNVYSCLFMALLSAAAGSYLHLAMGLFVEVSYSKDYQNRTVPLVCIGMPHFSICKDNSA